MNDKLHRQAIDAIEQYFGDCSVSAQETRIGLRDIRDHVEMLLDGLEMDLKNERDGIEN